MARGINSSGDLLTTTIDGVPLDRIWSDFVDSLNEWNKHQSAIVALFTTPTTASGEAIAQVADGDFLEEASEFGVPRSVRPEVIPIVLGAPLRTYDTATRYTRRWLRGATAANVEAVHNAAMTADNNTIFRDVMRRLLRTDRATNAEGATIYPLWDGAGDMVPPSFAGKQFTGSHSHYLVSGAATIDGGDVADMIDTITEHGYGVTDAERIVIMVHPTQGRTIRGFRTANGSPYDFIPSEAAPAYLSTEIIVGQTPSGDYRGLPIIGSFGKALISESYAMPEGYVVASATGGRTPLSFRQDPRQSGLLIIRGNNSVLPIIDATYERTFGIGTRHRGAAAVMQIKASGVYESPAI